MGSSNNQRLWLVSWVMSELGIFFSFLFWCRELGILVHGRQLHDLSSSVEINCTAQIRELELLICQRSEEVKQFSVPFQNAIFIDLAQFKGSVIRTSQRTKGGFWKSLSLEGLAYAAYKFAGTRKLLLHNIQANIPMQWYRATRHNTEQEFGNKKIYL